MALSLANSVAPSKNCVNGNGKYFPFSFQTGKAAQTVIEFLPLPLWMELAMCFPKRSFVWKKRLLLLWTLGYCKRLFHSLLIIAKQFVSNKRVQFPQIDVRCYRFVFQFVSSFITWTEGFVFESIDYFAIMEKSVFRLIDFFSQDHKWRHKLKLRSLQRPHNSIGHCTRICAYNPATS